MSLSKHFFNIYMKHFIFNNAITAGYYTARSDIHVENQHVCEYDTDMLQHAKCIRQQHFHLDMTCLIM